MNYITYDALAEIFQKCLPELGEVLIFAFCIMFILLLLFIKIEMKLLEKRVKKYLKDDLNDKENKGCE